MKAEIKHVVVLELEATELICLHGLLATVEAKTASEVNLKIQVANAYTLLSDS